MVQGVDGIRVAAQAMLGPRSFERFGVDLVTATVATGIVEQADPILDLGIPGLVRPLYRLYPLADTLADKFMGIIERHGHRPSTRFRDLVDIVLIARSQLVDASALFAALASEQVAVQPWWRDYAAAMSGVRAVGSHAPVVNSRVIASSVSSPHLVAVDR
jgi:hypothetical protein